MENGLWTNVKESNMARNLPRQQPTSPNCSNCGLLPERTIHLLYECPLAQHLWTMCIGEFNILMQEQSAALQPVILTSDLITPKIPDNFSTDLIHIIMTTKHRLYRHKFRDIPQRMPSNRKVMLSTALDLDKVIMVRKYNRLGSNFLNKIKSLVGL